MNKNQIWLRFVLFISCYVLFNYAYFKIPVTIFVNVIYYHGIVSICGNLIHFFFPWEQVMAAQNHLSSAKADLEIVRGCDGAGVLFLVLSAVLTYPAGLNKKLIGLLLGFCLVYGFNIMRISFLYFVISYYPDWFLLIHTYIAPTLMVIIGCTYFALWIPKSANEIHDAA